MEWRWSDKPLLFLLGEVAEGAPRFGPTSHTWAIFVPTPLRCSSNVVGQRSQPEIDAVEQ
jgi:hypothetical protein